MKRIDSKIVNGDFSLNKNGIPETLTGKEECLQSARLILSMKRGAFRYDRTLGSEISDITRGAADDEHFEERLLSRANEALMNHGLKAIAAETSAEGLRVEISTPYGAGEIILDMEVQDGA